MKPLFQVAHERKVLMGALEAIQASKNQRDEPLFDAITRAASTLYQSLDEFRWKVGDTIYYPFEHAEEDITLARFALPDALPDRNDVAGLLAASQEAIDRLSILYIRALGRLAVTAEEVERALGLAPIPLPQSEPDHAEA